MKKLWQEEIEAIKQRLNEIEAQLAKEYSPLRATTVENKRNEENRYISAPDILQNLGRWWYDESNWRRAYAE